MLWMSSFICSPTAFSLTFDGKGHFALRGETLTNPDQSGNTGTYQAIQKSFRLLGEARFNEKSSVFLEFRLFDASNNLLGDLGKSDTAVKQVSKEGNDSNCCQDTSFPAYKSYVPSVTRAYVQYAFDYFILEAGRRGRSWGLGLLLDEGNNPFSRFSSNFDGISFHLNPQKTDLIGFSVGYDKLSESGAAISKDLQKDVTFGPSNKYSDIDQYFVSVEHDDFQVKTPSGFNKQVGLYLAKIKSDSSSNGGAETDLTLVSFFGRVAYQPVLFKTELVLKQGSSADPHLRRLGGAYIDGDKPAVNEMQALGFASQFDWVLHSSGDELATTEVSQSYKSKHTLIAKMAYASGDADGYYNTESDGALSYQKRDRKLKSMAFHGNFRPALILFNSKNPTSAESVDGVFEPARVMNATIFSGGYRYENSKVGNFEFSLIYAKLNTTLSKEIADLYKTLNLDKPIGFSGNLLGIETDLTYSYDFNADIRFGGALGYVFPGNAWKTTRNGSPQNNALIQAFASFSF